MPRRSPPQPSCPEAPKKGAKRGKSRPAEVNEESKRNAKGQFVKGQSGNPGGTPKAIHEQLLTLRKMAIEKAPRAMEIAISWLDSEDTDLQKWAIAHITTRAAGKESSPKEMPLEAPSLEGMDLSLEGLLSASTKGLAIALKQMTKQAEQGQLADGGIELLVGAARTLAVLAKEDRQQREEGEEGKLTLEELIERGIEKLSPDRRRELLAKVGAPPVEPLPTPTTSGPAVPAAEAPAEPSPQESPQQVAEPPQDDPSFYE
jgi:hypothetical protein